MFLDGNKERRQEVLGSCARQIEGIMNCTSALVETLNFHIKTGICEHFVRLPESGNRHPIEEICEEQEQCEAFYNFGFEGEENVNQRKQEVVISLFDYYVDDEHVTGSSKEGTVQSVKLHELDIFDDWDWSSVEFDDQLEEKYTKNILHMQFYDDPQIEAVWNDFNFWKLEEIELKDFPHFIDNMLEELIVKERLFVNISKEDMIAWEDPRGDDLLIQYDEENDIIDQLHGIQEDRSPIISDDEDVEGSSSPAKNYLHFWLQRSGSLQQLEEGRIQMKNGQAGDFGIILDL